MSDLSDYVVTRTERGECQCGRCFDKGNRPDPTGHTVDMFFFKMATKDDLDPNLLKKLVTEHKGEYGEVNLFDGKEHSYIEIGGWIGDQGIALQLMGLGHLLGLWKLMTPAMLPGIDDALKMQLAGAGMITIQSEK